MRKHTVSATLNVLCIIIFFKKSFCLDPSYESCVPKTCGDGRVIRYPFFISGLQDPSCGYPGFQLQCSNGSAVIRISETDYLVEQIDYGQRSIQLVNSGDITCLTNVTNLMFDTNRFSIDNSSTTELVFLMNCTKILPGNLTRYKIGSCNPAINQLVMLKNDGNLGMGMEHCSNASSVPVETQDDEVRNEVVDGGNYEEVMKRGFTVQFIASKCVLCDQSGGRCGFNTTSYQFQCFCPDRPHSVSCPRIENKKTKVLVPGLSVGIVTLLVVIILCFIWKLKWKRKTKNHSNVEKFLKNHEFLARKRYSYSQVKKMTNSFQVKLGQGGFGTVYRGQLSNGNLVAVKILGELKGNGEDFINEVASVGRTSHVNIVDLVGYCLEGHRIALIYEFMPNGSLEKFIYGRDSSSKSQLGWEKLWVMTMSVKDIFE